MQVGSVGLGALQQRDVLESPDERIQQVAEHHRIRPHLVVVAPTADQPRLLEQRGEDEMAQRLDRRGPHQPARTRDENDTGTAVVPGPGAGAGEPSGHRRFPRTRRTAARQIPIRPSGESSSAAASTPPSTILSASPPSEASCC